MELEMKKIAVIGLGLIGGSLAKAIKQNVPCLLYGEDIHEATLRKAILMNAIDEPLTQALLPDCDLVIVALYPEDTVKYIERNAAFLKKGAIVIDCGGVKEYVCRQAQPIAAKYGFTFMGGHPMAGLEHSGFAHSKKALFNNASMILTPDKDTGIEMVQAVKLFFLRLGFTNIQISSPAEHDQIIAFSSQLAHVVSSAYIKSPSALAHRGFSAGSYKDLTRVAKLNEDMWTELFLENAENLVLEIDGLIDRLSCYSAAIRAGDADGLKSLLAEGRERKALIDGEHF